MTLNSINNNTGPRRYQIADSKKNRQINSKPQDRTKVKSIVNTYVSALGYYHRLAGLSDPTKTFYVIEMLKGYGAMYMYNVCPNVATSSPGPSLLAIFKMADAREKTLVTAGHVSPRFLEGSKGGRVVRALTAAVHGSIHGPDASCLVYLQMVVLYKHPYPGYPPKNPVRLKMEQSDWLSERSVSCSRTGVPDRWAFRVFLCFVHDVVYKVSFCIKLKFDMSEQHYPEFSIHLDYPINDEISDDVLQQVYDTAIDDLNKENIADKVAEFRDFVTEQQSKNTREKTKYDLTVWQRFCLTKNEQRELENIPGDELNLLLCSFFKTVAKKNGDQYEPGTLTSFQRSIQRYLNTQGSKANILKGDEFKLSREVLASKRKELVVKYGKGNRPQASRQVLDEEEDKLFATGELGREMKVEGCYGEMCPLKTTQKQEMKFWSGKLRGARRQDKAKIIQVVIVSFIPRLKRLAMSDAQ
ncbi:hypothetical protein QZH41_002031 [Actinostola sp. cb2023]|nr:hypothetical protein QZH41_002031 [Actinostola sp. cb2023]